MKIILSRKGFDSKNGGMASPILPDGRMVSLPIPDCIDKGIPYSALIFPGGGSYQDAISSLKRIEKTTCHLDPDLIKDIYSRAAGDWKPVFGQKGAPAGHLTKQGVEKEDLFLFFGTFRKTVNNPLRFSSGEFHCIFGYLQIGEIVEPINGFPKWMDYHQHCKEYLDKTNNRIYVSSNKLTLNKSFAGAGSFKFDNKLRLSKDGMNKSVWELDERLWGKKISFHKETLSDKFQSVGIGQEFVIEEDEKVTEWALDIIRAGMGNK